jgi:hypothetical protein
VIGWIVLAVCVAGLGWSLARRDRIVLAGTAAVIVGYAASPAFAWLAFQVWWMWQ